MRNNCKNRIRAYPILSAFFITYCLIGNLLSPAIAQDPEVDERTPLEEITLHSALYNLNATVNRGRVYRWQYGGGISPLDDGFILGTRQGVIYHFRWDKEDNLVTEQLAHNVPLNADAFEAAVPDAVNTMWFRVADVLVVAEEQRVRLFASHHFWDEKEQCTTARISMMEGSRQEILDTEQSAAWETIFETQPCLPIGEGERGNPFAGNHIGGRLAIFNNNSFLVSVGDHQYDGWNKSPSMPQDPSVSYGKVWRVDLDNYEAEIFSIGNRNAQGLWFDKASGKVWSTEHGAQGGDELNLLIAGGNYGWPAVTDGTAYGMRHWPMTRAPEKDEHFLPPVFGWVPSIGISNLVGVQDSSEFPDWQGDLLISSLRDHSIWRIRLREDQVAYAERIDLKTRVRDISMGQDGRIVLWTDEGEIISIRRQPDKQASE